MATNLSLNHLSRYRSRWRLFSELRTEDSDAHEPFEALQAAPGSSVFTALEEADRRAGLERALRGLPVHQRVPIVLFHFEDKTYQEIAELMRVSLAKVKTDIHRGREALRAVCQRTHGSIDAATPRSALRRWTQRPRAVLPRVMAAVESRTSRQVARPWSSAPRGWRFRVVHAMAGHTPDLV